MTTQQAAAEVENLIRFALARGLITADDIVYCRNALLDLLHIDQPADAALSHAPVPPTATPILNAILDWALSQGLLEEDTPTHRALFDTRVMGLVMPWPHVVRERFAFYMAQQAELATDWFYALCRNSNYIRVDDIARNILWDYPSEYGTLELTINLTKPEKDPREIAALKNAPQSGYPACLLCAQNEGYAGRLNHPARQTLRVIPVSLAGESWYFQFSPYVYYPEHCIVLKHEHEPMLISERTFMRLLDFLDLFPHYFIGSNAGLPIVGGSILNHDHFQGGRALLPMMKAAPRERYAYADYPDLEITVPHWPMAGIRLACRDREPLIAVATELLGRWQHWDDPACGVVSHTGGTLHNTFTPIARMDERGRYQLDLVLRNNITTDEYPMGLFHPHPHLHHIKQENIGLIEVMGLFILPGRLHSELAQVEACLCGQALPSPLPDSHPLVKHLPWLNALLDQYGQPLSKQQAHQIVQEQVGEICQQVLCDAGVYKDTPDGHAGLARFLASADICPCP